MCRNSTGGEEMKTLQELRKKAGLTQLEMAKKVGVERSTIARWEIDGFVPRPKTLLKVAKILGVSADEILQMQVKLIKKKEAIA
jgi:transcriptional regulator with XRE-family HTH domain